MTDLVNLQNLSSNCFLILGARLCPLEWVMLIFVTLVTALGLGGSETAYLCSCKFKCARTRGWLAAGSPVPAFFYADHSVPDLADDWLPGDPMTTPRPIDWLIVCTWEDKRLMSLHTMGNCCSEVNMQCPPRLRCMWMLFVKPVCCVTPDIQLTLVLLESCLVWTVFVTSDIQPTLVL